MTSAALRQNNRLDVVQWRVLLLLVFSIFINYIDRGNLSVAAPMLRTELHLNQEQMGRLLSAFFWTYAVCQVIGGWAVDKFNVKIVFGVGFMIWSLATACTGLVHTFATLFAFRLLLGIGESVSYPSYSKVLAGNFTERHRGLANGMIDAGSKCGPALGTFIGATIVGHYGWRVLFLGLGFGCLIWLPPWFVWGPRNESAGVRAAHDGPGYAEILGKRDAWGTFIGLFGGNYVWYFLLTWLPGYLVEERGFTMEEMAVLGALPFLGIAATAMLGGILSDRWIMRGGGVTTVRKTFVVAGLLLFNLMLPVPLIKNHTIAMSLMMAASLCFGFYSSNLWAITQALAGPSAAGKWTGLQNGIGNLAGVVAPMLTGMAVYRTGSFFLGFLAASVMAVMAAASFGFIVREVKPVTWRSKTA